MKLLIDENIPGTEYFERLGKLRRLPGRQIDKAALADIDALIVRSVTRVDQDLLEGTPVRFVGSATTGVDHVDEAYLQARDIQFASAPGSNASSVVDFVLAALAVLLPDIEQWLERRVAIIGCGKIGSRLLHRLRELGIVCCVRDPYLETGLLPELCSLDEALDADIITLHTPLTFDGAYPTQHLLDADRLGRLCPEAILINTARGAVIDNRALLSVLERRLDLRVALDVFEGEPAPDLRLVRQLALATPHIAGYAWDGKLRGAQMVYRACCEFFGIDSGETGQSDSPPALVAEQSASALELVRRCYDLAAESEKFKQSMAASFPAVGEAFDRFRRDYPTRREFEAQRISLPSDAPVQLRNQLRALGFGLNPTTTRVAGIRA